MVDKRIADLPEFTTELEDNHWVEMVDVSNTTDHASGSSIKVRNGRFGVIQNIAMQNTTKTTSVAGLPGTMSNGTCSTQLTGHSNIIYLTPFVVHKPIVVTGFAIVLASNNAGSLRGAIYGADDSFALTLLLADMGLIALATSGRKTVTGLSIPLLPGCYWLAAQNNISAAPTLQCVLCQPLWFGGSLAFANPASYSTAFPAQWTAFAVADANATMPTTLTVTPTNPGGAPAFWSFIQLVWTP